MIMCKTLNIPSVCKADLLQILGFMFKFKNNAVPFAF